ncbi:histidine kinase [Sphingobacterium sp. E70]|uniref:histidine kinase n=1 Tax=Sphingobacterium sp. E70 TaxID=2853439 RepID=UPI00211BDDAF|nr:sensor histidine kinase [Sphingobacterium sp. E70]ULT26051.1 histidine kinase [Sphingobacterium sp. E70]
MASFRDFAVHYYFVESFYINHYILIPAFVLRSRFLAYAGSLLVVYTLIFLVLMYLERQELRFIQKPDRSYLDWEDYLIIVILLTIFIAAVSSMKLFKVWIVNLIRFKEFENNTLTIQLEQLKSQINPHFLFNTLNNINFLIDENPKLASKVLLKLSDVLRNQLYLSKGIRSN